MKKIATTIVIAFAICSWGYSQEANHADTIMLIVNGQEALKLFADFQARRATIDLSSNRYCLRVNQAGTNVRIVNGESLIFKGRAIGRGMVFKDEQGRKVKITRIGRKDHLYFTLGDSSKLVFEDGIFYFHSIEKAKDNDLLLAAALMYRYHFDRYLIKNGSLSGWEVLLFI
nr:hypothetical protein [Cytophagales bacterium]